MSIVTERHVEWTAPAALWDQFHGATSAGQRRVFRTPAILRFASDTFMDDFVAMMQSDPRRLGELLAVPEKWTSPAAEVTVVKPKSGLAAGLERARNAALRKLEARAAVVRTTPWNHGPAEQPLKLYQPAHQRYYLVVGCLVCRTLGLPDRPLDTTKQEKATFVLRMLQPRPGAAAVNPDPADCNELALVDKEWVVVSDPQALQQGEEQHPLSPLSYREIDDRRRRLFNGMIPVARRESLLSARRPNAASAAPPVPIDHRQMMLKSQVLGPWASLEDVAKVASQQSAVAPAASQDEKDLADAKRPSAITRANEQIQAVSWYILLDLAKWLGSNLPEVWTALKNGSSAGLSGTRLVAYNAIAGQGWSSAGNSLRTALAGIEAHEARLESVKSVYRANTAADWPALTFQFVHVKSDGSAEGLLSTPLRTTVENALAGALAAAPPTTVPVRSVAQVSATDHLSPWFTVRCVFERPNCASLSPAVVSDPSAAFQLASFFDPDAPARPIRIAMPADTTPAGLRKYDKNTAFVLSDVLCGQVSSIRGLSFADLILSVLPFPLHADLPNADQKPCGDGPGLELGMVCSLSIPIITLCALIVLMIFIKLLDIVFFWMPFFQICLPVPKFDAKKEA